MEWYLVKRSSSRIDFQTVNGMEVLSFQNSYEIIVEGDGDELR